VPSASVADLYWQQLGGTPKTESEMREEWDTLWSAMMHQLQGTALHDAIAARDKMWERLSQIVKRGREARPSDHGAHAEAQVERGLMLLLAERFFDQLEGKARRARELHRMAVSARVPANAAKFLNRIGRLYIEGLELEVAGPFACEPNEYCRSD
jgi:hypothetical protein